MSLAKSVMVGAVRGDELETAEGGVGATKRVVGATKRVAGGGGTWRW